jgi:hypothetical protein
VVFGGKNSNLMLENLTPSGWTGALSRNRRM